FLDVGRCPIGVRHGPRRPGARRCRHHRCRRAGTLPHDRWRLEDGSVARAPGAGRVVAVWVHPERVTTWSGGGVAAAVVTRVSRASAAAEAPPARAKPAATCWAPACIVIASRIADLRAAGVRWSGRTAVPAPAAVTCLTTSNWSRPNGTMTTGPPGAS